MAATKEKPPSIEQQRAQLKAAERMLRVKRGRERFLDFVHLTMPDPKDPDDASLSQYIEARHHQAIAELLEKMERGEILRAIVVMPPRHGKSELASRRLPPWIVGKDPYNQVIFSTYSQEFADDFGREWRNIIRMPVYRQIFPGVELRKDSQAVDRMSVTMAGQNFGGAMVAVGRGGALTGRGAHWLIIDDPFKNDEEAYSTTIRDQLWNWFTKTAYTRLMPGGRVLIIMTRWHEDDIVGRIFDTEYMDPEEAKQWYVLKLPAIHDGKALWPERYPIETLNSIRRTLGPSAWSALYQGEPTPDGGLFFKDEWIVEYDAGDLPSKLSIYGASDHAVTEKQANDPNVIGCVGIDENDHIWVLPDLVWEHMETDDAVDAILDQMKRHKPNIWFAENDVIKKAFGPFLRKRQMEEKIYVPVQGMSVAASKRTRARAIQGRMAMKMVHFPRFASWWPDARSQLLRFDKDKHDDFVDWIAHIGQGLDAEYRPSKPKASNDNVVRVGSIEWVKFSSRMQERRRKLAAAGGF